jgi:hypothetical protein
MFYVQTSTLPSRMHQKLTKHGRFCKQNNQLPTKTRVELKDNSIDHNFLALRYIGISMRDSTHVQSHAFCKSMAFHHTFPNSTSTLWLVEAKLVGPYVSLVLLPLAT